MSIEVDRRNKMDKIRALGFDPFQASGLKFTPISDLRNRHASGVYSGIEKEKAPIFSVSGRVMLQRGQGKLSFLTIQSDGNRIQVALDFSRLTEQRQQLMKLIDLGDTIAAEGILFPTKTGECTIWANTFFITSKSLLPPPDKVEGLKDPELRIRNRHVDLLDPDVLSVMLGRSKMIARIRNFLTSFGYHEVETPILMPLAGGAAAKPFKTHHNALDMEMFLRIAPELYLKRLLVGGMEAVYEIGKNFRNEGISPRHNPEFTVLEAYKANSDYKGMMNLVKALIVTAVDGRAFKVNGEAVNIYGDWRTVRLDELVQNGNWTQKNEIFEKEIAHTLIQPTFVTHLPKSVVPLAKESKEFPGTAEVFELYIGGQEVSPGYTEENDPDAQLAALKAQSKDGHVMDDDFLEALRYGMPPAGGLGLGIDRLAALVMEQPSVRDVILFPTLKSTKN